MQRTLKGIRSDLGLTQEQMSKKMEMKLCNYKNLERGKTKMTATQFIKILQMANIDDYKEFKIS